MIEKTVAVTTADGSMETFVVHPAVEEILGHRTYPSVGDLPAAAELAVVSVGRESVLEVVSAGRARVLPGQQQQGAGVDLGALEEAAEGQLREGAQTLRVHIGNRDRATFIGKF